MILLVGLSGYGQSGKDSAAAELLELGWGRRAFADPLRNIATDLHGESGREQLQTLGDTLRSHLGADVLERVVLDNLPDRCIVTDCRLRSEAQAIVDLGGIVIRIERPGVGPANGHHSETELDDWPFDATVLNDGTAADLAGAVADLSLEWHR